jgi:hypothetical protein
MRDIAILIVNGGREPRIGRWLPLCIERIIEFTNPDLYHFYVWNNNREDIFVTEYVHRLPNATLLTTTSEYKFEHPHIQPLQVLYEKAKEDGRRFFVTFDTDAHPLCNGWLDELLEQVHSGVAVAGIWRDELAPKVKPYIHASCLCSSMAFVENHQIRLDYVAPRTPETIHDSLSILTETAIDRGLPVFGWKRSNKNQLHHLVGGIYGDRIYHHAAGSRMNIRFWTDPKDLTIGKTNEKLIQDASDLLFSHYSEYLDWLRGRSPILPKSISKFVFILGMHRSGTSCLIGALQTAGLFLGEVSKSDPHNTRGNQENKKIRLLNESIFQQNHGSWEIPPASVRTTEDQKNAIESYLSSFQKEGLVGIKDPRILFLNDPWFSSAENFFLIGTFRHPLAVAESLQKRNGFEIEKGLDLWTKYNKQLVRIHRKYNFPLIQYDLEKYDEYCQNVANLAAALGLSGNLEAIKQFVTNSLQHSAYSDEQVPSQCRELYSYLQRNRFVKPIHIVESANQ